MKMFSRCLWKAALIMPSSFLRNGFLSLVKNGSHSANGPHYFGFPGNQRECLMHRRHGDMGHGGCLPTGSFSLAGVRAKGLSQQWLLWKGQRHFPLREVVPQGATALGPPWALQFKWLSHVALWIGDGRRQAQMVWWALGLSAERNEVLGHTADHPEIEALLGVTLREWWPVGGHPYWSRFGIKNLLWEEASLVELGLCFLIRVLHCVDSVPLILATGMGISSSLPAIRPSLGLVGFLVSWTSLVRGT